MTMLLGFSFLLLINVLQRIQVHIIIFYKLMADDEKEMADIIAPAKKFTRRRQHLASWMDDECVKLARTTLPCPETASRLLGVGRI